MRRNRMTDDELLTVVRLHGYASLQDVEAVVLEPDGFFSVLGHHPQSDWSALSNVKGAGTP